MNFGSRVHFNRSLPLCFNCVDHGPLCLFPDPMSKFRADAFTARLNSLAVSTRKKYLHSSQDLCAIFHLLWCGKFSSGRGHFDLLHTVPEQKL